MATLSVRKIDDDVYKKLRSRAAVHGVSMEEEVRQILELAVSAPERLGAFALECFGREYGHRLDLRRQDPHEPIDFSRG